MQVKDNLSFLSAQTVYPQKFKVDSVSENKKHRLEELEDRRSSKAILQQPQNGSCTRGLAPDQQAIRGKVHFRRRFRF